MLLLALLLATGTAVGQDGKPRGAKRPAPPLPMAVPFQSGEQLSYRVTWGPADAATAVLTVLPQEVLHGAAVWRFQARASTIKATRFLYPLDDRFDSYADVFTLSSLQYQMRIREPNKNQDRIIRMSHEGKPLPKDGTAVRVPPGTCDPLGLIFALRVWDWGRKKEAAFQVYDGRKLYEVRTREIVPRGEVRVPAGNFAASRIELRAFEKDKELTTARFWIWLAADARRTPVLMEAELPFGKLRVELTGTGRN